LRACSLVLTDHYSFLIPDVTASRKMKSSEMNLEVKTLSCINCARGLMTCKLHHASRGVTLVTLASRLSPANTACNIICCTRHTHTDFRLKYEYFQYNANWVLTIVQENKFSDMKIKTKFAYGVGFSVSLVMLYQPQSLCRQKWKDKDKYTMALTNQDNRYLAEFWMRYLLYSRQEIFCARSSCLVASVVLQSTFL
jgi:hypothetical protein